MKARGKIILKIVGVLSIVSGIFALFMGAFILLRGQSDLLLNIYPKIYEIFNENQLNTYAYLEIVTGIIIMICGVSGMNHANQINKAGTTLFYGIVYFICVGVIAYFTVSSGQAFIGTVSGFILPVLYIVGALLNNASK